MNSLRRAARWGIELRFWVAACVGSLAAFAARAQGLELRGEVLALVCCSTLALYNLDGSLDAPERGQSTARRRVHLLLTLLALVACAGLLVRVGGPVRWLVLAGLAVSAGYAVPITWASGDEATVGGPRGSRKLKALPGIKAPFVGSAVAGAVVWVPRLAAGSAGDPDPAGGPAALWLAIALSLGLGLACTCNAVLFDVPDLGEDRRSGVPTWPSTLGLRATRWLCGALCLGQATVAGVMGGRGETETALALGVLSMALVIGTRWIQPSTSRRSVALWIDGALILPWAVLVAAPGAS